MRQELEDVNSYLFFNANLLGTSVIREQRKNRTTACISRQVVTGLIGAPV